jgi:hypothetical protein
MNDHMEAYYKLLHTYTDTLRIDIDPQDAEVLTRLPSYDTVRSGRVYKTRVAVRRLEVVEQDVYRLPSGKLLRVAKGSAEDAGTLPVR